MNDDYVKSKAPTVIIVFCAGFMMLIQTLASGLAVVGYDDVIRADAKAREAQILQRVSSGKEIISLKNIIATLQKQIINQKNDSDIRFNALEDKQELLIIDNDRLKLLAHEPAK